MTQESHTKPQMHGPVGLVTFFTGAVSYHDKAEER